jgi:hypothetical protein
MPWRRSSDVSRMGNAPAATEIQAAARLVAQRRDAYRTRGLRDIHGLADQRAAGRRDLMPLSRALDQAAPTVCDQRRLNTDLREAIAESSGRARNGEPDLSLVYFEQRFQLREAEGMGFDEPPSSLPDDGVKVALDLQQNAYGHMPLILRL